MTNRAMSRECPVPGDAIARWASGVGHWALTIGRAFLLALGWLIAQPVVAQPLRIVTWDVDGFATVAAEIQVQRLRQLAGHLKPLEAEVIVLHGLSDLASAGRLCGFLKPATYQIAHHSTFRKSGTDNTSVGPSITILSRKPAFTARSMEWRSTGQIDLPGGFAFAGVGSSANAWCVYVAHLPDDSTGTENPAISRKRELAAQYLAHHANWLGRTLTNQIASFYIVGDFVADPKTGRLEGAARILQQAGFKSAAPGPPGPRRISTANNPSAPPLLLTALLTRNADFVTTPQLLTRKPFDQPIIAYDLTPNGSAATPPAIPAATGTVARKPVTNWFAAWDEGEFWWWAGGITTLLIAILISVRLVRRATPAPGTFRRRRGQPVVMDLSGLAAAGESDGTSRPRYDEGYEGAGSGESDVEAAIWQARALQAEERASQATAMVRAGLMPQLRRLLRERLIAWLTSERGQLITSHEAGTRQMLELEERLQRIQGQFQDSLQTREQRIAELEQEILAKERVIRDLLRAQVRVADESASP
jgi:hypothetical protein